MFSIGDLNRVKAVVLHQVKCGIFNTSFLPKDDLVIKQLATDCLTAQVHHNTELSAWATTTHGAEEITKMCSTLITIRKNMQFLTWSAVLWGYTIHQLLRTETKAAVKIFVGNLIKKDAFLRGVINVNGVDVEVPFANVGMQFHIWQLLCYDRRYRQFISENQNVQPLYTFTSVLFKWALSELATGAFKEIDFKIADAFNKHEKMVTLFKTLMKEQIKVLTADVLD
ncbi:hypothetical protein BDR05DRAFT_953583 [Suillus weaverae]|nr:hypothetical protein BDR05DRAFT_953583 [Suillus weaverae]